MIRRLSLMVLAIGLAAAAPAQVTGPARVVDGDTFSVGAERVRLWGVDAPEGRQVCQNDQGQGYACGDVARDQLVGLIGGRAVRCEVRDRDPYGRAVARCLAGATDLGEAMVRAGWAVDDIQFSRGAYASAEVEARRAPSAPGAGRTPSAGLRHQGQHQRQGPPDLPCPGPRGLRRDPY
ncbi:MAG TPA: thermonuclease family protein [Caulobacter sp.]|nr:thermonuclease family protein [Caulobacter sp.]